MPEAQGGAEGKTFSPNRRGRSAAVGSSRHRNGGACVARENHLDGCAAAFASQNAQLSLVKLHGALGDGKADSESAGMGAARRVNSVEGTEDRFPFRFRYARPAITDFNYRGIGGTLGGMVEPDLDGRSGLGIPDGVADDVLDGAIEKIAAALDDAIAFAVQLHPGIALLRFILGIGKHLLQQALEGNLLKTLSALDGLHGREGEQLPDELIEALGF